MHPNLGEIVAKTHLHIGCRRAVKRVARLRQSLMDQRSSPPGSRRRRPISRGAAPQVVFDARQLVARGAVAGGADPAALDPQPGRTIAFTQ
jgi:hypothetical protein